MAGCFLGAVETYHLSCTLPFGKRHSVLILFKSVALLTCRVIKILHKPVVSGETVPEELFNRTIFNYFGPIYWTHACNVISIIFKVVFASDNSQ